MSFKSDFIAKHGEEAYANRLRRRQLWGQKLPGGEARRSQDRRDADPEQSREYDRARRERNPEKVKAKGRKVSRSDGAYYKEHMQYRQTGIQGEREKIRCAHGYQWRPFKRIIAPESQIHHEWIPKTAEYRGVALVEKEAHQYGIVDVIEILDGKITLLTEEEICKQKCKNKGK
jgi:3-hydroxymyristoyl/3-hydroxydecanoyl-(acyl carrier protein) dehydratase